MKIRSFVSIALITTLSSCGPDKSAAAKDQYIEAMQKKEFEKPTDFYENAGKLISKVEFTVKATDEQKKDWEDGIIPWISLENPNSEISNLVGADDIIIKENKINILFDYPLNKPVSFEFNNEKGFTRKDLILIINKKYHEIYDEEEKSAKTKTIPAEKRTGLINRNETDGKFGIWGHDLSDLDLSGIEIHQDANGKINIILQVES